MTGPPLPLSPAEQNRLETQREAWRIRQRRSRANRRRLQSPSGRAQAALEARVALARLEGIQEENEAALARPDEHDARLRRLPDATVFEWIKAHYKFWALIFIGGPLASRLFELTDGKHLQHPLPLIFEAARDLHHRGLPVDARAIDRELRRGGIILMPGLFHLIENVLSYSYLPKHFTMNDVEETVSLSKQA